MITLAILAAINPLAQSKMVMLQCAFLTMNPKATPFSKHIGEVNQQRHLANIQKLWEERKILAVGPVEGDPEFAGIAIIDAKSLEEVTELFKNDPYIKSGQMSLKVLPWYCENNFKKGPAFMDMEAVWFGVLERPDNAPTYSKERSDAIQAGHMANLGRMANAGLLAVAGPFDNKGKERGIVLFVEPNEKVIRKAVAQDEAIKAKRLQLRLMKWYLPKGTVFPYVPTKK